MNWLRNMRIQSKLFLAFGLLVSLLVFLSVFSGLELLQINRKYTDLLSSSLERQSSTAKAVGVMNRMRYINLTKGYLANVNMAPGTTASVFEEYNMNCIVFIEYLNNYHNNVIHDKNLNGPEKQICIENINELMHLFFHDYQPMIEKLDATLYSSNIGEINRILDEATQMGDRITEKINSIYEEVSGTAKRISLETAVNSQRSTFVLFAITMLLIVFSVFLSVFMTAIIKTPITKMENAMKEISRGNLEYPIHSVHKDELGLLANQIGDMVDSISEMNSIMTVMAKLDSLVLVTDLDYNMIYANQSLIDAFGLGKNNYKGKKCYKTLRNLDKPCGICLLPKLKESKEPFPVSNFNFVYDDILGEWIGGRASIIRWIDGSMVLLQTITDETEKKKDQEQLSEAVKAAEAASIAKSVFLANMSHEIRTPMNAVIGMAELLLHEKLNLRQIQYTEDIRTSAIALLNIINDILDVSKLQAGKFQLIPVHYNFSEMIDNVCSIVSFMVEEKNKELLFELIMLTDAPAYLYGDDMRLRQVLLNLLSNAVKFTEKGCVLLVFNFTDTTIQFTVIDTGMGIAPDSLSKLFEPFEQSDVLKNRNTRGTGLGLTITKATVEMMGGKISVDSTYGKGSCFHVEIPVVLGDAALITNTNNKKETVIYAPDAKILVVDDNETNLNVACGLLQICSITADTATSGRQAIDMVRQKQYDIVFMDHRMPEMSGIETTRFIRDLGIDVPIIALTASAVIGAKEMMLEAGMDDYLWKPVDKTELMRTLKKWIPAEKLRDPPPEEFASGYIDDEAHREFWSKIEQIKGLDALTGLNQVDGRRDVYEKTLKLMLREISKSKKNLTAFLADNDMQNFCIEVHGMKSSLANIGSIELSARAYALETASEKMNSGFCSTNLPLFLEELNALNGKLSEAFLVISKSGGPIEIPQELLPILKQLSKAMAETDFLQIEKEMSALNNLKLCSALDEEIEQINDAVMIMDYDEAEKIIKKLLESA